jgi:hypothetical protein
MIKYILAAQALKALSLNNLTKTFYQNVLGNVYRPIAEQNEG